MAFKSDKQRKYVMSQMNTGKTPSSRVPFNPQYSQKEIKLGIKLADLELEDETLAVKQKIIEQRFDRGELTRYEFETQYYNVTDRREDIPKEFYDIRRELLIEMKRREKDEKKNITRGMRITKSGVQIK